MDLIRIGAAVTGFVVIVTTFYWATRILMVKGADPPGMARLIIRTCRNVLHFIGDLKSSSSKRHELWSLYIPLSLLSILAVSLVLATFGFMLLLYGVTQNSLRTAYENSVSSMSTLGIAGEPKTLVETTIGGIEAFTGPVFVALLIAYTVSIYSAYSHHRTRIEAMDALLAGNSNGGDLLCSFAQNGSLAALTPIWASWETEFEQLDKNYRSVDGYLLLSAPNMSRHWSFDAPMVMDAAAMRNTLVQQPPDPSAAGCIAAGTSALEHLTGYYQHTVFRLRRTTLRTGIDRAQFEQCANELAAHDIAIVADLDRAWLAYKATHEQYAPFVAHLDRMLPIDDRDR